MVFRSTSHSRMLYHTAPSTDLLVQRSMVVLGLYCSGWEHLLLPESPQGSGQGRFPPSLLCQTSPATLGWLQGGASPGSPAIGASLHRMLVLAPAAEQEALA